MSFADHSLLSLFPATRDQILESRKRTSVQWGRGLTLEQYLQRESRLDTAEHAQGDKFTTWRAALLTRSLPRSYKSIRVLAPRADPATLDFKCACET